MLNLQRLFLKNETKVVVIKFKSYKKEGFCSYY